jgi:hypothetical protein
MQLSADGVECSTSDKENESFVAKSLDAKPVTDFVSAGLLNICTIYRASSKFKGNDHAHQHLGGKEK